MGGKPLLNLKFQHVTVGNIFSSFLYRIISLEEAMMLLATMTMPSFLQKISRLAMSRTYSACSKR